MRIIADKPGLERALKNIKKILRAHGPEQKRDWSFPDGYSGPFPTWIWEGGRLAIGFSAKPLMKSGRPIILSLENPALAYSSSVEINIPPEANSAVQGCFAIDKYGTAWLCHRGSRLTTQAFQRRRLKKRVIHDYFRKWIVPALERNVVGDDTACDVIRVTPLSGQSFHRNLHCFAFSVKKLKQAWITHRGSDEKMKEFISRNRVKLGAWE